MDDKLLGSRIAKFRKEKNLSQKELANKLNVSNKTISKWECGNGNPDIQTLSKMVEIFDISIDELINEKEKNNETHKTEQKQSKNRTPNKKLLLCSLISALVVIVATITLLCCLFIPRTPKITKTKQLVLDKENATLSCVVSNKTETFSLNDKIKVPYKNTWKVYLDIEGIIEISSQIIALDYGDNECYIIVENQKGTKKTYTLNIRRRPLYLVNFDAQNGEFIPQQIIEEGSCAVKPENPTKSGYTFNGWNENIEKSPITENKTFIAKWIANEYTISFNAGNNQNPEPVKIKSGEYIENLPEPTKTGYYFIKWEYNLQTISNGTIFNFAQNIELVAVWGEGEPPQILPPVNAV